MKCVFHKFSYSCLKSLQQIDTDIDKEVQRISQNLPYLVLVAGNSSAQVFVMTERLILHECSFMCGLLSLIVITYFAFNIEYPKPLYAPYIFLQHIIFNIKGIPTALVRLFSALDNME